MFDFNTNSDRYYAIIVKNANGTDTQIKRLKVKPDKPTIQYKNLATVVDFSKIVWRNRNRSYFLFRYDIDKLVQLSTSDTVSAIDNALIDTILNHAIVSQIVSGLSVARSNMPLMFSVVLLITGILAGYFLGSVFPYSEIAERIGVGINATG